ncbi:TPA: hypothetical protein I9Y90_003318 [Elizabethkingia anophelis]|nr:hypothetical protein [Elizabethkingia anophelis]HAT4012975.1 hypothetical protein [Elizabethkingia anophelis]
MNWGLIRYSDTISFDYINDIFSSIKKNIVIAAINNNKESFNELLDFIISTFIIKSFNRSEKAFSKSVILLVEIYPKLPDAFKEIFIKRSVSTLSLTINVTNSSEDIENTYLDLSYLSMINLLKIILEDNNYTSFNTVIKVINENTLNVLFKDKYLFNFRVSLLSWIYFLKSQNKISYESYDLFYFENYFDDLYLELQGDFITNFYKLYEEIEKGLWAMNEWEISAPPENVAYFALMPSEWLRFGLVVILLKYDSLINTTENYSKISLNPIFKYQFESIKKQIDLIIQNEQLTSLIFSQNIKDNKELKEELNYKKDKIIDLFSYLKNRAEIEEYKIIKTIPLSQSKIDQFRESVGKRWEENTVIISILNFFDKINYLEDIEEKKFFGYFVTLTKSKFAFIDGEKFQEILGLNSYGNNLARDLDNQFFSNILQLCSPIEFINTEFLNMSISNFVDSIDDKNKIVIFANSNFRDFFNLEYSNEKSIPFSHYSLNNIPIVNSFNKYKDFIFVVNFNDIEINIYRNDSNKWYNNQLFVDVTEFQNEVITSNKVSEWSIRDGYEYNKEEIDVLESNNVDIKILFKSDYILKNKKSFIVFDMRKSHKNIIK